MESVQRKSCTLVMSITLRCVGVFGWLLLQLTQGVFGYDIILMSANKQ